MRLDLAMYACMPEIGRGFFEGVCAPSNATAHLHDPPPYNSRIEGWGWVAEMGGRLAGCAHPLEKSVDGFWDINIHR